MAVLLVRRSARARAALGLAILAAGCRAGAGTPEPAAPPAVDAAAGAAAPPAARWWKGNTHTHSLWSDGDHFPEMISDWYGRAGYDFLAMTDHNPPPPERWVAIPEEGPRLDAYRAYRVRFGDDWVERRNAGDTIQVRLRRLDEYRVRLEKPGRFLLVSGEEITQYIAGKGAHMNAINLAEPIAEQGGPTAVEILRRDLAEIRAQRERTGRPMFGVLNHPNFIWSQTAEDLLALPELRFFEVYNGHPLVNILGDSLHAGNERIWDIVLTGRRSRGGQLLYGVATDDAHDYLEFAPARRNPGRGWVMVRATTLSADSLVAAMERGDFYASTGVELTELRFDGARLSLSIRAEPGVTYTTRFIGTRRGYDTTSHEVRDSTGAMLTRRYSGDVGAVLAESTGESASYAMRGDELYVRARVISSKAKSNPSYADEVEMAWTQPVGNP
jgi:hypothetical protein